MNFKINGWLHPLAKKTSHAVAHHAMGVDQDGGSGHAFTRCVPLPVR